MQIKIILVAIAAALIGRATPAHGDLQAPTPPALQLSFDDRGQVSLFAQNVSIRDILAEWARQCGCYVVNGEKLAGAPNAVPVQFEHQPQAKVLESLLRSASGYALTPRRPGRTGVSDFETIYIVATSAASASAPSAYVPQPYVAPVPIVTPGSPDDEIPPVTPLSARPAAENAPAPSAPPPPAAPRTGVPGIFVPIVPVGPSTPAGPAPAPNAPGRVVPVPVPNTSPTGG